ncbi:6-phosphofructokinase (EC [Olavius algarvensis Delta 1 endosymbiont]|nr:6-phosphofructokinase (EC [Olavius algarvensis Delta 1 endosymbiont]
MKISIVIATKNEEKMIKDCLESVLWADEIVIVDDESEDRTVEICKEYTSKIVSNESKGNFHYNKNLGIEESTGDWILSLDADERITIELANEIRSAIKKNNKLGYYISRKNYFLGNWIKGCGWYPDYIIRLFKKGATNWPDQIHDVPQISPKSATERLKNPMIHMSYRSLDQFIEKFSKYTTKIAKEEYEKGVRITKYRIPVFFIIKPAYWFLRKYLLLHGFRDGFRGLFICFASFMTVFMTYAKLWEIQEKRT